MRLISLLAVLFTGSLTWATILPPNDLHLEDHLFFSNPNINEQQFNEIIDQVMEKYQPIVEGHGATLRTNKRWTDSTVNASAQQSGNTWIVNMYGGLARRPETTPDGFAMVVCHELGHHLAGFAFYGESWAASEGQSDYFASQACARKIWGEQHEINAQSRATVDAAAKEKCDAVWDSENEQNLCYRIAMGGKSLATLLGALGGNSNVKFETPDTGEVSRTSTRHPAAQCRLDTYFQGGLCKVEFKDDLIPGRHHPDGQTSEGAELVAAKHSCTRAAFHEIGNRPRCWYAPQVQSLLSLASVDFIELTGNGNGAIEPGEIMSVSAKIENNATKSYDGIRSIASSNNSVFEVIKGESNYSTIGAGQVVEPDQPFEVKVANTAICGTKAKLGVSVKVGAGAASSEHELQLGRIENTAPVKNDNSLEIPDNNAEGISSDVIIDTTDTFKTADVTVDISHSYIGDLTVTLISPDAQKVVLHKRTGGSKDDLKQTFSVDLPQGAIANGTWKLHVTDSARSDNGRLNGWSVIFGRAICE